MNTYIVHLTNGRSTLVAADRIFVDGSLRFFKNVVGEKYGETRAAFACGQWQYFKLVKEAAK